MLKDFGMEPGDSVAFEQVLFIIKEMRNQCAHLELITRFKIKGKPSLNYFNDIKSKASLSRRDLFYIDVLREEIRSLKKQYLKWDERSCLYG